MLFFFSHVCRIIDWNRSVNVLFSDVSKPLDDDCTVCSVMPEGWNNRWHIGAEPSSAKKPVSGMLLVPHQVFARRVLVGSSDPLNAPGNCNCHITANHLDPSFLFGEYKVRRGRSRRWQGVLLNLAWTRALPRRWQRLSRCTASWYRHSRGGQPCLCHKNCGQRPP